MPQPWLKSKGIISEAIEMKYFLNTNSALNDAISSLSNPNGVFNQLNNDNSSDGTFTRGSYSLKYVIF